MIYHTLGQGSNWNGNFCYYKSGIYTSKGDEIPVLWTRVTWTWIKLESEICWLSTRFWIIKEHFDFDMNDLWLHLDSSFTKWNTFSKPLHRVLIHFQNQNSIIIYLSVCSESTVLFSQQRINFQQISTNLHFQGECSSCGSRSLSRKWWTPTLKSLICLNLLYLLLLWSYIW